MTNTFFSDIIGYQKTVEYARGLCFEGDGVCIFREEMLLILIDVLQRVSNVYNSETNTI